MKPYPRNSINFTPITPIYITNNTKYKESRYSMYRLIDNLTYRPLEIKLSNSITQNKTYNGYYYTTTKNETLYSIAKTYYENENLYWILAKANGLRNNGLAILPADTTIVVPNYSELQKNGGYFSVNY